MGFVGREKEMKQLFKVLNDGGNLVITGRFGIGKTALVRRAASMDPKHRRFLFADFSQTAGQVCNRMVADLFPGGCSRKEMRSLPYRKARFLLSGISLGNEERPVVVLDNVCRLTGPKRSLLGTWNTEERFSLVAIVESALPDRDLFLLRSALFPAEVITLGHLSFEDAVRYFSLAAEQYLLNWTGERVRHLAEASGGYPLCMKETVARERSRLLGSGGRAQCG